MTCEHCGEVLEHGEFSRISSGMICETCFEEEGKTMRYIIAKYNNGLKMPCEVTLDEAQAYYAEKCREDGLLPGNLALVTSPSAFCDLRFNDYLWIIAT